MKNTIRTCKNIKILLILMFLIFTSSSTLLAAQLGDVNNSSTIDIVDALMTAQYYVGLNPSGFVTSAADVSGDGAINIIDALMIAQYYVGLIDKFPASATPTPTPAATRTASPTTAPAMNFISRNGARLYDGSREFRFVSVNIPDYFINEDRAATVGEKWHRVTEFEQRDAARAVQRLGGQVFRTYVFSVQGGANVQGNLAHIYRNTSNQIAYNEELFRDVDRGLAVAAQEGVRMYIPLVDNWQWFGGYAEWASLSGGGDFWSNATTKANFKSFITYLVNRTNTITGKKYKDDPTIMAWELGNEIDKANAAWISEIAAHLKSADPNHLIIDGGHKTIPAVSLSDSNVDIITTHYTDGEISNFANQAKNAGKPYIYGEYSPDSTSQVQNVINTTISSGAAGCLIWSLRFRTEYGGFYYHSDFNGASDSLQYPGFSESTPGSERQIFTILRNSAYQIQGLSAPQEPAPPAPLLLAISSPGQINWQGSAGAFTYTLQRRPGTGGTWSNVAANIVDIRRTTYNGDMVAQLPLYADNPGSGTWNYRVIAVNGTGESAPSNIVSVTQ